MLYQNSFTSLVEEVNCFSDPQINKVMHLTASNLYVNGLCDVQRSSDKTWYICWCKERGRVPMKSLKGCVLYLILECMPRPTCVLWVWNEWSVFSSGENGAVLVFRFISAFHVKAQQVVSPLTLFTLASQYIWLVLSTAYCCSDCDTCIWWFCHAPLCSHSLL